MNSLASNLFNNCLIFVFRNYQSILTCLFVACCNLTQGQTVTEFTTNGTFTVPSEITAIRVEAWGGGGAGGSAFGILLTNVSGGGGGGGAYNNTTFSVVPGQQYTIAIGLGGTTNGANGGASQVLGFAGTLTANGGSGGESAGALLLTNMGSGGSGGVGFYNGGTGSTGVTNNSGAGGGGADDAGNGGNPSGTNGGTGGAGSVSGGNGANSATGNNSGNNGSFPGGGGSGGRSAALVSFTNRAGGQGGNGLVRITAYRCYPGFNTTWNGTAWSNGNPTSEKTAIIDGDYNTLTNGNIVACSCQVNAGKTLTIGNGINNNYLEIYNEIVNNGIVEVTNNASLIQWYNTTTNTHTGTTTVTRNANPMKRLDFSYWSSPVANQTLVDFSPNTLFNKYFSWTPSSGWTLHNNGAATMQAAKGYIIRAPQTFPLETTGNFTGIFSGAPHNGDQIVPGFEGSESENIWNLIGNPYPSAIDADLFLTDPENSEVGGTIYLWTHNTPPLDNGSGQYSYSSHDYATYNLSGGVATAATDDPDDTTEDDDNNSTPVNGYIASGQAFFIQGIKEDDDLEVGPPIVKFKNSMRIVSNNSNFFKPSPSQAVENWQTTGKHRFWINLRNSQGAFNQALIGYVENATDGQDRLYDGELFGGNYVRIYSLLGQKKFTIQGKALPFNNQDVVPMGYKTTIAGNFYISLDHFDGLFSGQDIFIKDNVLNIIHDLKEADYHFASEIGTFNQRFEIIYQQQVLSIDDTKINPESIIVYKNENAEIIVNGGLLMIDEILVYDITGRLIHTSKKINSTEFFIQDLPETRQVLILDIKTSEGFNVAKKIIF